MIKVKTYWFVIRQHQPITTFILIWPLLWALLIAGAGGSSFDVIIILAIGAFLANTAACILDDISEISAMPAGSLQQKTRLVAEGIVHRRDAWEAYFTICILLILLLL